LMRPKAPAAINAVDSESILIPGIKFKTFNILEFIFCIYLN
jgi:hypothetical protein